MPNFSEKEFPLLLKREGNLDKFSKYIRICSQNNRLTLQWEKKPSLKRNLELYEQNHEKFSNLFCQPDKEIDIAHFWRDIAVNESKLIADWEPTNKIQLALEHLASYFEERCYWAIKDLCKKQKFNSWEDYLCIARTFVYNPLKLREILLKYEPEQSNLETYISRVITNHIKSSAEVNRFSSWRLLYKKSEPELQKALEASGYIEPQISQFIFARRYFKQVYLVNRRNPATPKGQKWIDPAPKDFEQAAQCYNAEKLLPTAPHEVSANSTQVTANQIENWMKKCIKALVNFQNRILPKFSLDMQQSDKLESQLVSKVDAREVKWQQLLAIEETTGNQESRMNRVNSVLSEQLRMMRPDYQTILLLYYGFNFNQKQISARLGVHQSTISRILDQRVKPQLLDALAGISEPHGWVPQYIEKWLQRDYRAPQHKDLIQATLVAALKKLTSEGREILQLYYGQRMDENQISSYLGIHLDEVTRILMRARNNLQDKLMPEIDIWMEKYLNKGLRNYYQSLIKSVLATAKKPGSEELDIEEKIYLVEIYIQNQH